MFDDFTSIFQYSITLGEILANVSVALICGLLISVFYKKTYTGPGYLNSFVNSLVLLSIITSIVIMIIGNNLARAFGLVGAMSIIRFRTAVKETQDIIYIFFALTIGMAAGVGLHGLAVIGTLFIGLISVIFSKTDLFASEKKYQLLQFTFSPGASGSEREYIDFIDKLTKRNKLLNVKAVGAGNILEISYHVIFKNKQASVDFLIGFRKLDGIDNINLFYDEEYF